MADEVGLVGVGLLGTALAERLLASGFTVLGYDLDPARLECLTTLGGRKAGSLSAIAQCTRVVLSLPDSRVVGQVVQDMMADVQPGTLLLDTTTGSPEDAERAAAELLSRQVGYAEVTIAGSSDQVRRGESLAMIGAERQHLAAVVELAGCWAKEWVLVGVPGQAARMKLTVNLVLGLHRAVLAEGLAFARAQGLDEQQTLDVLRASPAYSTIMDTKGGKMLAGDYTPQARLRQHLKDVQLMLEQAQQHGLALPLTDMHRTLLEKAVALGFAELDNSAIRLVYGTD